MFLLNVVKLVDIFLFYFSFGTNMKRKNMSLFKISLLTEA